jgi:superfamily II DNA or RNA helicase
MLDQATNALASKSNRKKVLPWLGLADFVSDDEQAVKVSSSSHLDSGSSPFRQLKDYQFDVFFKAQRLLLDSVVSRFILQMPTGAGKTRTAMEVVSDFLNRNKNGCVIWVAHSRELCDQAMQCFADVWPHLGTFGIATHRVYGHHSPVWDNEGGPAFVCASFQMLVAMVESGKNIGTIEALPSRRLIVVDEAHKVVAPTYKKVTRSLIGDHTSVMGLTATPGRGYGALNSNDENLELSDFFFNTIVSFESGGEDPIEYLRKKNVLARARMERLAIDGSSYTLSAKELEYANRMFDLPQELLSRLAKDKVRNAEIVSRLLLLLKKSEARSVLYFATSLEQSKLISCVLRLLNVQAAHVDGSTPLSERDRILSSFKEGNISILCNYEVLSTGFDAPKVDCVFIARPTTSVVLYSQVIGRGLRGPAIGGKEQCLVVNVKDNILNLPGIEEMYQVFDGYWSK